MSEERSSSPAQRDADSRDDLVTTIREDKTLIANALPPHSWTGDRHYTDTCIRCQGLAALDRLVAGSAPDQEKCPNGCGPDEGCTDCPMSLEARVAEARDVLARGEVDVVAYLLNVPVSEIAHLLPSGSAPDLRDAERQTDLLRIALAAWEATTPDGRDPTDAWNDLCALLESLPDSFPDELRAALAALGSPVEPTAQRDDESPFESPQMEWLPGAKPKSAPVVRSVDAPDREET